MKKRTSLNIETELWKKVKKKCIDIGKSVSDYLEELMRRDLRK